MTEAIQETAEERRRRLGFSLVAPKGARAPSGRAERLGFEIVRKANPDSPIDRESALGFEPVETPQSTISRVVSDVVDGLGVGLDESTAEFYGTVANGLMVYRKSVEGDATALFREPVVAGLQKAEDWARAWAEHFTPPQEDKPSVAKQAGRVFGALPLRLGTGVAAYGVGGPAGLGMLGAVQAADQGPTQAMLQGGMNYAGGVMAKNAKFLPSIARPVVDAASGAGQVQAQGGGLKEQIINAALAGVGHAPAKPRTIRNVVNKAGNINLDMLDTSDNIKQALKVVAEQEGGFLDARRGVRSHKVTLQAADELGMTQDQLLARKKGEAYNPEQATGARQINVASANDLVARAQRLKDNPGSDEASTRLMQSYIRHMAIQEQVSGVTAEAGRTLNAFKIRVKDDKLRVAALADIQRRFAGKLSPDELADMITKIGTPEGVDVFTRKLSKATTIDMIEEAWINGLLSGPTTHVVNVSSNALTALYTAGPETIAAAAIGAARGNKNRVLFREAGARMNGMRRGIAVASRLAADTFATEQTTNLGSKIESQRRQAIPGVAGKMVRIPGRFLEAEDVWFKTIVYSGEIEALATRQAVKEGLKGEHLATRIQGLIESPPEAMAAEAWQTAKVNTFTNDLGKFGQWVQKGTADFPPLKVVMPFVRTPGNILKFALRRTPVGITFPSLWKDIMAGGAIADKAIAQGALGSTITASLASYMADGSITGGGPKEQNKREALYRTGWQPYSIKVGDTYYSYARFEPIATMLGTTSDFVEISDQLPTAEQDEIAGKIAFAVAHNVTDKIWLQGLTNLVEFLDDPKRYGQGYLGNLLGSIVPVTASQFARAQDAYLRDVNGVTDNVKNRIPGLKETLEKRLDFWGNPIKLETLGPAWLSPVRISEDKHDRVSQEMVNIDYPSSMPERKIGDVELPPAQYWDFVAEAGRPAKKALDEIVRSPAWDKMQVAAKQQVYEQVISGFRKAAAEKITQKYRLREEQIRKKLNPYSTFTPAQAP